MFCPNCGAQNPDTATTCQKCGFNLKGSAAPKFKGTMLMMNATGAPGMPKPGQAPNAAGPAAGSPGQAPQAAPGEQPPIAPRPKLKGTMIGVAPPSAGAVAPPGGGPGPMSPGTGARGGGVNPLGGTMVAGPAGMGGPPPGGSPYGAQPQGGSVPQQGAGGPPPGGSPYGAPPQQGTGGPPPGGSPYGAPPQQAGPPPQQAGLPPGNHGYGSPAQDMGPPQGHAGGYGVQPGAPAAYGNPNAQPGMPVGAAPLVATSGMRQGDTAFPQKAPAMVFLLWAVTCGIYALFWFMSTAKAIEARGEEIGPVWHLFIPVLNILWVWKWCQGVEKVSGGELAAGTNLLKVWLLGGIGMAMLQSHFNRMH